MEKKVRHLLLILILVLYRSTHLLMMYLYIRTIDVLKSVNKDSEVIQYMHSRRYVEMLVQVWKDALKKHRLNLRDYMDIALDLDLINHLMKVINLFFFFFF